MTVEMIRSYVEYHHTLTRRLWDSIMSLTDAQFVQEIDFSRGSVRNQMVSPRLYLFRVAARVMA